MKTNQDKGKATLKTARINVRIAPDVRRQLEDASRADGVSIGVKVRHALAYYLAVSDALRRA